MSHSFLPWQIANAHVLRSFASVGARLRIEGRLRTRPSDGDIVLGADIFIQSRPFETELEAGRSTAKLTIEDRVRVGHGCVIAATSTSVSIGADTFIGPRVRIVDTNYHDELLRDDRAPKPIVIGRGVRIGAWSMVAKGSEIGNGAVVEPGAVVAGRVAPGAVVAGMPARPVRPNGEPASIDDADDELGRLRQFLRSELALPATPAADEPVAAFDALDSLGRLIVRGALEDLFGIVVPFHIDWRKLPPAELLSWKRENRS